MSSESVRIDGSGPPNRLGSLAQAARGKQLRAARGILLFVGIASALVNAFMLVNAHREVDQVVAAELQREGLRMDQVDQTALAPRVEAAVRLTRLLYGGTVLLGIVFILLGVFIYAHPVAITMTGLVLYVAATLIFALIAPMTLAQGIVVKFIIVILLAKAISSAVAYQREKLRVEDEGRRDGMNSSGQPA